MDPVDALARRIEAQPAQAGALVDAFLADHDFPLVDAAAAVFVYRGGPEVTDVLLVHWVFGLESRVPFLQLPGTTLRYLPVELPTAARIEYKLEVARGEVRSWVRDPLNPQQAFDPFGSNSVCTMPGYVVPRWVSPEPDVRPGRMVSFGVQSAVFGGTRTVQVYLPAEFEPTQALPLVICHDGPDYLGFASIRTVLDNLIGRNEVAPLLVAFVSGEDRNREYGADPRQPDHLVLEVLPALRDRFRISDDPADLGLMGASFGGVASLFTAWQHPGVFGRLLLQSGSFVFTDVGHHGRSELFDPVVSFVNALRAAPERTQVDRVFLSCGTFESLIWFNRSLGPILRRAGVEVRFVEANDGHNWIAWRDQLRAGLTWLFPGRLWMIYD